MMAPTLLIVVLLAAQVPAPAQAPMPAQDRDAAAGLAAARQLYASASYEEALERLNRLNSPAELVDQVDTYRALCQLALGRTRESERTVERILERNPKFVVDEQDTSPRLVMVFRSVRARLLPTAARNLYAAGRASFDAQRYGNAVSQLRELIALLDTDPSTESGVGDLRVLAEGFLRQAELRLTIAAGSSQPPTDFGPAGEPIYSIIDRDVIPPVEISRPMPTMVTPRGGRAGLYQTLVEVVISESGRVEQLAIRKPLNPDFDAELLAAAAQWRFQAATKAGKPVKFRRSYEVIGHSR